MCGPIQVSELCDLDWVPLVGKDEPEDPTEADLLRMEQESNELQLSAQVKDQVRVG